MRHLYIRKKRDSRVLMVIEADEKSYQGLSRGILRDIDDHYYLDDSEFVSKVTPKQSENGFLLLICVVILTAFLLWLLGGA